MGILVSLLGSPGLRIRLVLPAVNHNGNSGWCTVAWKLLATPSCNTCAFFHQKLVILSGPVALQFFFLLMIFPASFVSSWNPSVGSSGTNSIFTEQYKYNCKIIKVINIPNSNLNEILLLLLLLLLVVVVVVVVVVVIASSSWLFFFFFFFAIEILCEGQRTNRPLSDGLYTLSITSPSFRVSAMPRYDKFHSLFEDILAQITLDFSSKLELRSVLKERAAFAIIFAIKHVCYSSRITIIVKWEMLTNRYCL